MKNIRFLYENLPFLFVKCLTYLNGRVFVMVCNMRKTHKFASLPDAFLLKQRIMSLNSFPSEYCLF